MHPQVERGHDFQTDLDTVSAIRAFLAQAAEQESWNTDYAREILGLDAAAADQALLSLQASLHRARARQARFVAEHGSRKPNGRSVPRETDLTEDPRQEISKP
jgi:hypothetical protein